MRVDELHPYLYEHVCILDAGQGETSTSRIYGVGVRQTIGGSGAVAYDIELPDDKAAIVLEWLKSKL